MADRCFLCACTPSFIGCRLANEPELHCPQVECASPLCCHTQSECSSPGTTCVRPGAPQWCGACRIDPGDCTDDNACANGQVCNPIICSCNSALQCEPGCTSATDCGDGLECSGGAHPRCVARQCNQASACGDGFDCTNGRCARRACSSDSDCGPHDAAFCVQGACYRGLGECRQPVP